MPVQPFGYNDLGGGLNSDAAPTAIQPNEMQKLENWYPYSTRLRRRGGIRRLTSTSAWDENITAMFPLKTAEGTWILVVAGPTKFGRLDGTSVSDLTLATNLDPITSSTQPWTLFQYLNHAYALRKGHTEMVRISEDLVAPAGIAAPTTACTIAEGAAGSLSAGDYKTVVTYYNQATGMESNPSPVSNTLTLGASKTIDYSAIPISSDPFVDARRVYRTLLDQSNEYFFAFQVSNNVDTVYTGEEVAVADLGAAASFDNGVPPSGLEVGAIWNERLFASDGTDLYFSEFLLPEMFSGDVISVFPDDGHVIRGLLPFGDRLIIGKTNKVHYLVGTGRADFAIHTLSDAHGCASHHSMRAAEGVFFWYGTGKAVYRSDGATVHDISTPKIADILADVPDDYEEYVIGAVYPQKNWYVLSVPTSEGNNSKVLVYNYKYGTWTVFTHPSDAPQFLGDFFTTDYGHVLYGTFYDGHIYHYNDETYGSDWGTAIDAVFRTKRDGFQMPGYRKFFKEVWLLVPDVSGGTIGLKVYRDDVAAAVVDRTASLDYPNSAWKVYKVQSSRYPGSTLDLEVTYSGADQINVDQIHFEVGLLPRRPMKAR
jgi:hypothetical protein